MTPSHPRPVHIAGRVFVIALVVLGAVAIAGSAWIGVRALAAENELRSAQGAISQIRETLTSDPSAAVEDLTEVAETTTNARDLTSDIVWQTAEHLPWIGAQLAGVSTVTRSLDEAVRGALPLVDSTGLADLTRFAPVDGVVDTTSLVALQEPAQRAATSARDAADAVAEIDQSALVTPLVAPVKEAATALDELAKLTDGLARASEIVPAILGADGPRDYLIVMQNSAEWRSLGGIPGTALLLHTNAGGMQIVEQVTGQSLSDDNDADLTLDPEVEDLFGVRPGRWFQNITQIPDFSIAGSLAADYWIGAGGAEVDGVISVDPVVLSYVLAATGPITLSTGDVLTADNAVSFLVNEVYLKYPVEQTDTIFAEAAAAVFEALVSANTDAAQIAPALIRGIDERRILLWSASADEQALMAGTSLVGELPVTDGETARFGVYVNEGGGAKIDYYLALGTATERCEDGRVTLRVKIQSDAPQDIEDYPVYINADGNFGVDPRFARTITYVYLPRGATLVSAEPSAGGLGGQREHQGLQVLTWQSDLAPGESATLDVVVELPGEPGLDVITTPTINTLDTSSVREFCDLAEY